MVEETPFSFFNTNSDKWQEWSEAEQDIYSWKHVEVHKEDLLMLLQSHL